MANKEYTHHCKHGLVITLPDVITYQPSKPVNCPCCGRKPIVDDASGYDYYAIRLGLPRKVAYHMLITMPRQLNYKRELPQYSQYNSPRYTRGTICESVPVSNMSNSDLAEYSMRKMPQYLVNGTASVNAHCTSCGSTFVFKVSSPDNPTNPTLQAHHKTLTYCPYCATPTLAVTHEPYNAWQALADVYNMSTIAIQAYYKFWTQQSPLSTFAQFMETISQRFEQDLKTQTAKPTKLRKVIRLRVKATTINMPPKPVLPALYPLQIAKPFHMCESCNECEISNIDQAKCETCKINYLTLHTEFTITNGGC